MSSVLFAQALPVAFAVAPVLRPLPLAALLVGELRELAVVPGQEGSRPALRIERAQEVAASARAGHEHRGLLDESATFGLGSADGGEHGGLLLLGDHFGHSRLFPLTLGSQLASQSSARDTISEQGPVAS